MTRPAPTETAVRQALEYRVDPVTGCPLDGPGPRVPIEDPERTRRHMQIVEDTNAWWREARRLFHDLIAESDFPTLGMTREELVAFYRARNPADR